MNSSRVRFGSFRKVLLVSLCGLASLLASSAGHAERLRDLASFQGVRENQLVGYGLVVGLDGSGDQTTQTPFTVQSVVSMLQQLGVNLPTTTTGLQLKNVAAVMVTASLPPFAQPGQTLPVTVSSLGNAKSLRGGTLLLAPLKGADGQIYAMAQGSLVVGGVGAAAAGSSVQVNHLDVGLINNGATVERAVPSAITQGDSINMELNESNFATASRVVNAVNQRYGSGTAMAVDARVIRIRAPISSDDRVNFIGALEDIDVTPAWVRARVILNARTGSVVMNQAVTLDTCAVSHGNLTVVISTDNSVSQPGAFSNGTTVQTQNAQISINATPGKVIQLKGGTSLTDVVKALNSVGATPQDLLVILQAMKAAGALHADLDII
ncbi:MAG TPA: flagellar basal body P-ring protein FlgI [Herbaspirillum sp.]|nr:flagellar basal body P-ring protein FlgI [Herbaspirillum sp.]